AISNVGQYCAGIARLSHALPHTGDDRTRRCRYSPPAGLPFPTSRICLESIVRTSSLGGRCFNISRETINNRTGNLPQAHFCWRSLSNPRDRRLAFGDKHTVPSIRIGKPASGSPIKRNVTPWRGVGADWFSQLGPRSC